MIASRDGIEWSVTEPPSAQNFWRDQWPTWEPDTLAVVDRFVTPGSTLIDVGAWIGPVSLWAMQRGANVIAIEPDAVAFDHLERNLADNFPRDRWATVEGALTRLPGWYSLAPDPDYGFGSSMSHIDPRGEREVRGWTLADLFAAFDPANVSLVKADTEGSEADFLSEVGPFLAERGIPLWIEQHVPLAPVLHAVPGWLSGFELEGEIATFGHLLCVPK